MNLFEETGNCERQYRHQQLLVYKLSSIHRVSTMRNRETELREPLLKLHKKNNRINVFMYQMQITNSSNNTGHQELAQQLQTSKPRNQAFAD